MAIAAALVFALVETGVRLSGLTDFPTYHTDADIGYMPHASQSGRFLNQNDWVFNDKSMGTERPWEPARQPNIILIGNSIVMGGNPYPQDSKLGPLIQSHIGGQFAVWPVAAGGWTNVNESIYLKRNPDVSAAASFFVWEYMSGGLSKASPWAGEYVFPSKKPLCATWYVVRRYVLPKFIHYNMNELPPTGAVAAQNLALFDQALSTIAKHTGRKMPGLLFIYPGKQEYLQSKSNPNWLPERQELERLAQSHHLKIIDMSRRPEWNESLYREGTHPTVQGNQVLARILATEIKAALATSD